MTTYRIAIVEDIPVISYCLEKFLKNEAKTRELSVEIETYTHFEEALEGILRKNPSVILTNMHFPMDGNGRSLSLHASITPHGSAGEDLINVLHFRGFSNPIVIFSGMEEEDIQKLLPEFPNDRIISKRRPTEKVIKKVFELLPTH